MKSILVNPGFPAVPVEINSDELRSALGCVSFAYPYDDPVCLAHDDDGIANRRPPNRTINNQIMPGPFYILGVSNSGKLMDLSPELEEKYLSLFSSPEDFPPGRWKITTMTTETKHTAIISIVSAWESFP